MLKNQTEEIRKLSTLNKAIFFVALIVLPMSFLKNVLTEQWAKGRNEVACVPVDSKHTFAPVYLLSSQHPVANNALVSSFVAKYIELTQNENVINFHAPNYDEKNPKNERYQEARLSKARWQAITMSTGPERALNKLRYAKSTDRYKFLKKEGLGIVFLIDEIITMPVIGQMNLPVVVRGQFELIYDQKDKGKTVPPEFLGYKEIRLTIQHEYPQMDLDNEFTNKYGLYVISSDIRSLSNGEKRKLEQKSREYLIHEVGRR